MPVLTYFNITQFTAYGLQLIVIVSVIVSIDSLTSYPFLRSNGVLLPADVAVRSC